MPRQSACANNLKARICRKRFSTHARLLILSTFVLTMHISSSASDNRQRRQPQRQSGVGWAMEAMQALTGGIQVTSVTDSGTVKKTSGGDQQQGSITLQSTEVMPNQITISADAGNCSEMRSWGPALGQLPVERRGWPAGSNEVIKLLHGMRLGLPGAF